MTRQFCSLAMAMMFCLSVSLAHGAPREKEEPKKAPTNQPPGESSAQHKPEGEQANQTSAQHKAMGEQSEEPFGRKPSEDSTMAPGTTAGGSSAPGGEWSQRTHSGKQSGAQAGNSQESGHPDAAGYAAEQNNTQNSGAKGAAAGATAANRNNPQATGAQGAAAGAAVASRNNPQATGAEGAAAGAALVNRNQPQVSGVDGAMAGATIANRNAPAVSGAAGAAAGYATVRNSFNNTNIYGQQWYGANPGAWAPSGFDASAAWQPTSWNTVATQCGYPSAAPVSYDYGNNVICQDGNVLVNGRNVGTTAEYSQQAAELAAAGTAADTSATEKWLPLGVFAMVRDEQQQPRFIVQLAINKQGILRGNYTDDAASHTMPIHGSADKDTQRAAWTVGENNQTVMEAGLNDLTGSEAPALIHKNGKTDHWLLVRLEQPKQDGGGGAR